jgi:hypothetical protein
MRVIGCLALVAGVATAQPGQTVPSPSAYQPQLTDDERDLLAKGEISDRRYTSGALASFFVGFGIGQALEGRWSDTGYIFTLGETASAVALIYGLDRTLHCFEGCSNDGSRWIIGGTFFLGAFRVVEIVDALIAPPRHNQRVRELRSRLGYPSHDVFYGFKPLLTPPKNGDGAVAGFELRF